MSTEFKLEKFLPYLINTLAEKLSLSFSIRYEKYNISIAKWRIIAHLGECPLGLNQKNIGIKTQLNKVEVSRNVSSLIAVNILVQKKDSNDSRNNIVTLTPSGIELYSELTDVANNWQKDILSRLNKSEVEAIYSIANKLDASITPNPKK